MLERIGIVARREFLHGIRSRWFLIGTIGLPMLMLAIAGMTVAMTLMQSDRPVRLVLVDESRAIRERLAAEFPEKLPGGERRVQIDVASLNSLVEVEKIEEQLREKVNARQLDGYIHLPEDFLPEGRAELYGLNVSNIELNTRLRMALTELRQSSRLIERGLTPQQAREALQPAQLETYRLGPEGEAERDTLQTFALVYLLVILLYFTVILYGGTIGRSIVEEKVSRIVEVMLSSVRPFELLAGKVLGVGAVGLVQTGVWVVSGAALLFAGSLFAGDLAGEAGVFGGIPSPSPAIGFFFLLWFVLGYFLYALLYALVASIVGSEEEAQQLQMPISMVLLIPLIAQPAIIQNPDSTFAVVMSFIPIFSPVVVFMRTAVLMPPAWQIVGSLALTSLTILALLWATSRIYRVGILSYGKRPRLAEVARWVFRDY